MILLLPVEIRDAIVAYLLSRPMGEVEQGVFALRSLDAYEVPEQPQAEAPAPEDVVEQVHE